MGTARKIGPRLAIAIPLLMLIAADSNTCLAGDEEQRPALRDEAFAHVEAGRMGDALPLLEEIRSRDPGDLDVVQTIGYLRYRAEDFTEARAAFEALLAAAEDTRYPLFMLGNIALHEFRLADAGKRYDALAVLDQDYPHLAGNRMLLDERIGRVRKLKDLRGRCDFFYHASLAGGVLILLGVLLLEIRARRPS